MNNIYGMGFLGNLNQTKDPLFHPTMSKGGFFHVLEDALVPLPWVITWSISLKGNHMIFTSQSNPHIYP